MPRWPGWLAALAAIAIAAPGHAVDFPDLPLQTGSAYPPANVLFILDDSGSMEYVAMPRDIADDDDLDDDITDKSAVHNPIYYDPKTTYQPWMQADGTRYTGGRSYRDAYSHDSLARGSIDLADDTRTFFVPKPGAKDLDDTGNYYRYQIRWVGGKLRMVRSEYSSTRNEGEDNAGCSGGRGTNWRFCTFITPTGRDLADELVNYATWYSYHRTRIKVAKAGASEAFGQLGDNIRVGYDSIWNRNAYAIPVGSDGGRFRGDNRSDWFDHLHDANGSSGTPLKGALQRAGEDFSNTGGSGPWGPGTGAAQISCRQNFAILTTDGYWNDNSGYTAIGDADGEPGATITSKDGKTTFTYVPANPYKDDFAGSRGSVYSQGDTLADVAMHYWKRDLVPGLANDVPASDADPAFWQHMVTFGVSIGLRGRLDPKNDLQAITNGSLHWGDPTDREDLDRIDDLWHASVNGHGNFVTATSPTEFVQGLIDALATVAARLGSASNVTANSTSFQTDTRVYQASYVSGRWTGELAAYEASAAGVADDDRDGDGLPDAVWRASAGIPSANRKVYTWEAGGKVFPTSAQETALDASDRALAKVDGRKNAAYVGGARNLEKRNGGELRDRATLLGDIANSSPMYVKDTETLFVGANDGMLHAIDARTGVERFAYVPAGLDFDALATLSDPHYVHRYFVDGPVTVSTAAQTAGHNYLVAALGRGGRGVFGLDVTRPASFGTGDVLWDDTGAALGDDMGQVLGEPLVVSLNDGSKGVLVSNGINSPNGHAVLFVLDIASGAVLRRIDTGAGGDNGLFAPRGADLDLNGTVDAVYAGDLQGNLWKFDLGSATPADWGVANGGAAMFVATDGAGNRQPITAGLALAREPVSNRLWVFLGTGRFLSDTDVTSSAVQSMYGVVDAGATVARGDLAVRDIVVATTASGRKVRGFEAAAPLPADKKG
jgi:type IV pilus assembly protein PilY1